MNLVMRNEHLMHHAPNTTTKNHFVAIFAESDQDYRLLSPFDM